MLTKTDRLSGCGENSSEFAGARLSQRTFSDDNEMKVQSKQKGALPSGN